MFTDLVAVDSVYKFRELKLLVNFVTAYFVDKKYATLKTITIVKMKLFFQNKFSKSLIFYTVVCFLI